jgi:hypothetical protein
MKVPLHYKGAEESQAVKLDHCVVNHVISDLDISCLPGDLPEFIEVDLSGLKKGMSLHLADIKLPKGVTAVTHGKPNPVLVSVVSVRRRRSRRRRRRRRRSGRRRQGRSGAKGGKAAKPMPRPRQGRRQGPAAAKK